MNFQFNPEYTHQDDKIHNGSYVSEITLLMDTTTSKNLPIEINSRDFHKDFCTYFKNCAIYDGLKISVLFQGHEIDTTVKIINSYDIHSDKDNGNLINNYTQVELIPTNNILILGSKTFVYYTNENNKMKIDTIPWLQISNNLDEYLKNNTTTIYSNKLLTYFFGTMNYNNNYKLYQYKRTHLIPELDQDSCECLDIFKCEPDKKYNNNLLPKKIRKIMTSKKRIIFIQGLDEIISHATSKSAKKFINLCKKKDAIIFCEITNSNWALSRFFIDAY